MIRLGGRKSMRPQVEYLFYNVPERYFSHNKKAA